MSNSCSSPACLLCPALQNCPWIPSHVFLFLPLCLFNGCFLLPGLFFLHVCLVNSSSSFKAFITSSVKPFMHYSWRALIISHFALLLHFANLLFYLSDSIVTICLMGTSPMMGAVFICIPGLTLVFWINYDLEKSWKHEDAGRGERSQFFWSVLSTKWVSGCRY